MAKRLDQILVIDVEATCWNGAPPKGQISEIIEVGLCVIDITSLERTEKRSILIKPVMSEISEFCTKLTTITADMFDNAGNFADATRILKQEYKSNDRLWASWGDYDRRQFEKDCKNKGVGYPFGSSHLNVKSLFATSIGRRHEAGIYKAYEKLGMTMEGTHHRGDDDAWNIAGMLCLILKILRNGFTDFISI